ncbi:MAG: hypothetical protein WAK93_10315 [Solirubrobacteraceae bacterium]
MPSAKLAAVLGVAALSLSACGSSAKPEAGTLKATVKTHTGVDDPRKTHIECLQSEHIPVRTLTVDGQPAFQVGTAPSGPTVVFQATPGAAQAVQINGQSQGAEVIGSALLYPNQAPDALLGKVESCVAKGVSG